jgi:hypothetical protein
MIENADRVDGYEWDNPDLRISYVGEDLQMKMMIMTMAFQIKTRSDK